MTNLEFPGCDIKEEIPDFFKDSDGGVWVNSLYVEKVCRESNEFNSKKHFHIIRDIQNIIDENEKFGKSNFGLSSYTVPSQPNRGYTFYWLTEDALSVLMGGYSIAHRIKIQKELRAFKDKTLLYSYQIEDPILRAEKWIEEQKENKLKVAKLENENQNLSVENKVQEQQLMEYAPKVDYHDEILQSREAITITKIAKDYGVTANKMNKVLHKLGIQFKQSGTWLLYADYAREGYTKTKTHKFTHTDGRVDSRIHTYWTQKGRLFLYEKLKAEGFVPLCEQNKEGLNV